MTQNKSINVGAGGILSGIAITGDENQVNKNIDDKTLDFLLQIDKEVKESENAAAVMLWQSFTDELKTSKPNKSKLSQFWDSLIAAVPSITALTTAVEKIKALF
jgi:hypothetical protein